MKEHKNKDEEKNTKYKIRTWEYLHIKKQGLTLNH